MTNKLTEQLEAIPDKIPVDDSNWRVSLSRIILREEWIEKGMFAFVSHRWVKPFADWIGKRQVLEVMAGAGWLARALREYKIDVIATDDYSWHKKRDWKMQTDVEEIQAADAITKYGKKADILIISWPHMDSAAYEAIKLMIEVNPETLVVYIGEDEGGCTADTLFFEHFSEIWDEQFKKAAELFQRWPGMHDYIKLGKYYE